MPLSNTIHKFTKYINENFIFEAHPRIAVGVSGGPDSLALLLLSNQWIQNNRGTIVCLTVNHNIRPEAAEEAVYTQNICNKYRIEHHILSWKGTNNFSNLQKQARDARRELLTEWCNTNNIQYLFLAHTQDDIVETFFIRLFRGSGTQGLSSISPLSDHNGISIIRPLLEFKKSELEEYLKEQKIEWVKDPSNHNDKFLRTKIRKLLKSREMQDIIEYNLLLDRCHTGIKSIQNVNSLLEQLKKQLMLKIASMHKEGYITLILHEFIKIPKELALSILASCLITVSGTHFYRPRLNSLQNLYEKLISGKKTVTTLWSCEIKIRKNYIFIYYEHKNSIPQITVINTNCIKWDNRFIIKSPNISQNTHIPRLDHNILKKFHEALDIKKYESLPKKILYSLPVLKIKNKMYVPFLTKHLISEINISFEPSIPLAK